MKNKKFKQWVATILFGMFLLLLGVWLSLGSGVVIGWNENQTDKNLEYGIWSPGMTFAQSFLASQENVCRIDFAIDSYHAWETPSLEFRLYELLGSIGPTEASYAFIRDNRREVRHKRINGWLISPHMFHSVFFAPIPDSNGKHYLFTIEVPEVRKGGSSILLGSPKERYEEGHLFVNGEKQEGNLAFRVLYKQSKLQIIRKSIARLALQKPFPFSKPVTYYLLGGIYLVLLGSFVWLSVKKV